MYPPNILHAYKGKSLHIPPYTCDRIPQQCRPSHSEHPTYFHGYCNPVRHVLPLGALCLSIVHGSINRHAPRPLIITSSSFMHCASRPLYLVLRPVKRGELLASASCFYRLQSLFLVSAYHVDVVGECVGGWLLMRTEEPPTSMLCHLHSGQDTWIHMICKTWTKRTRKKRRR
jgi:hypothetical protein